MSWRTERMIRRGIAVVVGATGVAWMAWDSYVLYQIMLAVSR